MSRDKETKGLLEIEFKKGEHLNQIAVLVEELLNLDMQKVSIIKDQETKINQLILEKIDLESKLAEKSKLLKFEGRIVSLKEALNKDFS